MDDLVFRQLRAEEFQDAYRILVDATDWLIAKGIRQWTVAYPEDRYHALHEEGRNWGLVLDGKLGAVVTLSCEAPVEWKESLGTVPVWWLSKLATAQDYRRRGLGALAVRHAIGIASKAGSDRLCLDCVHGSGFLVDFYRRLDFNVIDRRNIQFSTVFDVVLMEMKLRLRG